MKYCATCGAEYEDSVTQCSDCPQETRFVTAAELPRKNGRPGASGPDARKFVLVVTVDDPLTAERFGALLTEARIPVDVREQQGGTVDRITDGVLPFWEILVPEGSVAQAASLISDARARIEAEAEEAGRAAEEEATSGG